jgi:5-methyltetrahydrofolate--homocysteine methyltransferase
MADLQSIADSLVRGDTPAVEQGVRDALAAGIDPLTILDQGLTAGMAVVGACFRANEIFVPEVLVAARAMTAGLALLEPHLAGEHAAQRSTIIIGTVQGDIHDIGKNLVAMMLRGAGHRVIDLGINVPPPKFVRAIQEHEADMVALSALLTTTMIAMPSIIQAVRAADPKVRILVGGAPVNAAFAQRIGADGYGANATDAVTEVARLAGRA